MILLPYPNRRRKLNFESTLTMVRIEDAAGKRRNLYPKGIGYPDVGGYTTPAL